MQWSYGKRGICNRGKLVNLAMEGVFYMGCLLRFLLGMRLGLGISSGAECGVGFLCVFFLGVGFAGSEVVGLALAS